MANLLSTALGLRPGASGLSCARSVVTGWRAWLTGVGATLLAWFALTVIVFALVGIAISVGMVLPLTDTRHRDCERSWFAYEKGNMTVLWGADANRVGSIDTAGPRWLLPLKAAGPL
jgi:hypothetical protein